MKDEFVTVKTAILAKENGFNERCDTSYAIILQDTTTHKKEEVTVTTIVNGTNAELDKEQQESKTKEFYERFARPTKYQLQKWLRENNIYVDVLTTPDSFAVEITKRTEPWLDMIYSREGFQTYEEAVEEGLQKGILLRNTFDPIGEKQKV